LIPVDVFKDRAALARARANVEKLAPLMTEGVPADVAVKVALQERN
jgi:hypothetical protein